MNQFSVGDCVVHIREGVYEIIKIETANYGDGETEYYILRPHFYDNSSTIMIPVNKATQLRPHISKKNALILIKKLKKIKTVWINDSRKRKEYFQNMITSGNIEDIANAAHMIFIKKNEFIKAKKSMPLTDQNLVIFCEKLLNEELAVALGIKYDEVNAYIEKHSK